MNFRKSLLSTIFAASLTLGGASAIAQDATPEATAPVTVQPQTIKTADGEFVGYVTAYEDADGVHLLIKSSGEGVIAPGEHGVHIHETGVCERDDNFESAGGHFNPTDEMHGDLDGDPSHGGDLGNMTVADDGSFEHNVVVSKVTLSADEANSLQDADGSAIVIHAGADDLSTDPSGESGDREACGVIFAPMETEATPAASPAATPES